MFLLGSNFDNEIKLIRSEFGLWDGIEDINRYNLIFTVNVLDESDAS